MMILGVILLWIIIYVSVRLGVSYFTHQEHTEVKLKFSEFADMYAAAPEKYDIGERYTTYEIYDNDEDDYDDDFYDEIRISFSFLDYMQYRIWLIKIKKQEKAKRIAKKAEERSKKQREFLNYVAKDMECSKDAE